MKTILIPLLVVIALIGLSCKDLGNQPKLPAGVIITVQDITVVEGQTARIIITLNRPCDSAITFDVASLTGLATAGADFTTIAQSEIIPAGVTKDTILVATIDDAAPESAETFTVRLSNLNAAEFADSVATVTITDNDSGTTLISFAGDIKPLLNANCLVCHGGTLTQSGFSVGTYNSIMTSGLRGPNVVAGNSAASRLYIATTSSPTRDIDRMPQGGPYLTTQQQNLIKTWIDQGALNN
jgi:hypothetical protein